MTSPTVSKPVQPSAPSIPPAAPAVHSVLAVIMASLDKAMATAPTVPQFDPLKQTLADYVASLTSLASAGNPALVSLRDAVRQGLTNIEAKLPARTGGGRPSADTRQAQECEGSPAFYVNFSKVDGQSVVPDIDRPLNAQPSKADIARIQEALKGAGGNASVAHNTNPTLASASVFLRVKSGKGNLTAAPMPEGKTHAEKA